MFKPEKYTYPITWLDYNLRLYISNTKMGFILIVHLAQGTFLIRNITPKFSLKWPTF